MGSHRAALGQGLKLKLGPRWPGEAGGPAPGGPGILYGLGPASVGVVVGVCRDPADPGALAKAVAEARLGAGHAGSARGGHASEEDVGGVWGHRELARRQN
jgi:hypothetical protein